MNFGGGGGGLGGALIKRGVGGHALAAGAHGKSGCWEGLAGVGRDNGGRAHFHGPQLLHLPLKPPILLSQRPEPSLQVLTFHLCLLQLAPVEIITSHASLRYACTILYLPSLLQNYSYFSKLKIRQILF